MTFLWSLPVTFNNKRPRNYLFGYISFFQITHGYEIKHWQACDVLYLAGLFECKFFAKPKRNLFIITTVELSLEINLSFSFSMRALLELKPSLSLCISLNKMAFQSYYNKATVNRKSD